MIKLELNSIRVDGGIQARAVLDFRIVEEYHELMVSGAIFPPVTVFNADEIYWLADGFHRYYAVRKLGSKEIDCEIIEGTKRDAILYAVGANSSHGLRRTNGDKKNAVEKLLNDMEWVQWSDGKIAETCRVSQHFVSNLRKDFEFMQSVNSNRVPQKNEFHTQNILSMNPNKNNSNSVQNLPNSDIKCLSNDSDENKPRNWSIPGMNPNKNNSNINMNDESNFTRTFIHPKTGQETQMNVSNIGKKIPPVHPFEDTKLSEVKLEPSPKAEPKTSYIKNDYEEFLSELQHVFP